jgi:hypothetical protein
MPATAGRSRFARSGRRTWYEAPCDRLEGSHDADSPGRQWRIIAGGTSRNIWAPDAPHRHTKATYVCVSRGYLRASVAWGMCPPRDKGSQPMSTQIGLNLLSF